MLITLFDWLINYWLTCSKQYFENIWFVGCETGNQEYFMDGLTYNIIPG